VLGIYVSGHPLSEHEKFLQKHVTASSLDFLRAEDESEAKLKDEAPVCVGGMISQKKINYTKSNKPMAFLTLEDMFGTVEVVVFPQTFEKYGSRLEKDEVVAIKGRVSAREDEDAKVIANEIIFRADDLKSKLFVKLNETVTLETLSRVLEKFHGNTPVVITDVAGQRFSAPERLWVATGDELADELEKLLGEKSFAVK